jgi:hypothetical protein
MTAGPMTATRPAHRPLLLRVLLVAGAAGAIVSGCGSEEASQTSPAAPDVRGPGDLEDPYDGPLTADFREDLPAYAGQEVTLTADVVGVLSPVAFTVTAPDGADVEPLLVLATTELPELRPGQPVVLAAEPQGEFELTEIEEALDTDLPDEVYEEWEGEPYLSASIVQSSP